MVVKLLTLKQTSEQTHIPVPTLRWYRAKGIGPKTFLLGGRVMAREDDVDAWIQEQYDAGKKVNGRKRHIVVDTLGLLLVVIVTAANVQDRDGGKRALDRLRFRMPSVALVWADGGYAGRLVAWAQQALRVAVEIVRKKPGQRTFEVLPRRWVVERTFAWVTRCRRLARDYERSVAHSEAMVLWAMIGLMTRRLAPTPGRQPWQRK